MPTYSLERAETLSLNWNTTDEEAAAPPLTLSRRPYHLPHVVTIHPTRPSTLSLIHI